MTTRRARFQNPIARAGVIGALVIAVAFGAFALDSIEAGARDGTARHTVIASHDAHPNIAVASSTRTRGNAWFAALVSACAFATLAGFALGGARRVGHRCGSAQSSIRLRAPPAFSVAH